jgi:mono/diheme cytochrome c family protein
MNMRLRVSESCIRGLATIVGAICFGTVAACGPASQQSSTTVSATAPAMAVTPSALANGESIFQTGLDLRGTRITARPRALFPTCAACHRASGAGGVRLPGGAVSADLRHSALITGQKHPYTIALLERAISTGVDTDGQALDHVMPRWQLSKRDLHDVAAYVMTLR